MKRLWSLLPFALLGLGGCTPSERAPAKDVAIAAPPAVLPTPSQASQRQTAVGPRDLFGQWRVVGLTGAGLSGSHPIHLLIGSERVEAASQCMPFRFALDYLDGKVALSEKPDPITFKPGQAEGQCARADSPAERAFRTTMLAVTRIEQRAGGRVALVGSGGEALIERPALSPVNPFGNTEPPPSLMWGEWQVVNVAGGQVPPREPMRLLFGSGRLEAMSGCVSFFWAYSQRSANLELVPASVPHAACERMQSPWETRLREILDGVVTVTQQSPTERLLSGAKGTVLLRRNPPDPAS